MTVLQDTDKMMAGCLYAVDRGAGTEYVVNPLSAGAVCADFKAWLGGAITEVATTGPNGQHAGTTQIDPVTGRVVPWKGSNAGA